MDDSQNRTETASTLQRQNHRFRWRLIPTILFGIFGVIAIAGAVIYLGMVVYVNWKYGVHDPSPETPNYNKFALTFSTIAVELLFAVIGVVGCLTAYWSWKDRRTQAWIGGITFVGANVLLRLLMKP